MNHPKIVLDTNSLLQILGARSIYHFLFSEFLADRYTLCVSTEILFDSIFRDWLDVDRVIEPPTEKRILEATVSPEVSFWHA